LSSITSAPTETDRPADPVVSAAGNREAALVLVKAVPRPSKDYRETVCCAGITAEGAWRRLYPVRFRQLGPGQQFARWQWVNYAWRLPTDDPRKESRRIEEDSLRPGSTLSGGDRLRHLLPLLRTSTAEAAGRRESLALIEPRDLRLRVKAKKPDFIEAERRAFQEAGRQQSWLDREIAAFEPCPYAVAVVFTDQDGVKHAPQCGDWETTATFFQMRRRGASDAEIIRHLEAEFTEARANRRIFLAMGTVAKRPRQWLLLGVLRVPATPAAPAGQLALGI